MQADIRQQLIDSAPQTAQEGENAEGGSENGENGEDGGNAPVEGRENSVTEGGTGQDSGASGETGSGENSAEPESESNPYVNEAGQVIDPATGEPLDEDTAGFDTPVSGILGGQTPTPESTAQDQPESE